MNKDTAEKLVNAGIQAQKALNNTLYDVRDELTAEEMQRLRRFVGATLSLINDHIYLPLFREFPELKPPEYDAPWPPESAARGD